MAVRRLYLLLSAVTVVVVGVQVFLLHWRAAFRSKAMDGPVVMAPIIAGAGSRWPSLATTSSAGFAVAIFAVGLLDGLFGLALHLRGVPVSCALMRLSGCVRIALWSGRWLELQPMMGQIPAVDLVRVERRGASLQATEHRPQQRWSGDVAAEVPETAGDRVMWSATRPGST